MSSLSKNKITIITVVKNNKQSIERCIKSVIKQKYKNIEYIVVDGNSSDGTKQIINKYKSKIDFYVSENDLGIWDAMNKGISLSTGDIIGFLNSDDFYYENALEIVSDYFEKRDRFFIWFGKKI